MKAIISVNNLGFIGLGNQLLWHSSEDLKHFKKMTDGGRLLVGYNTHTKLPKLPNREVVVDHRDPNEYILDVDWCIGGKKTYEKYCQYFTELHISYVNNNKIGDVRYPELKLLNPECKTFKYYFK